MADPTTIGVLAASALAIASEAALKGAVTEAAKDTWKALKEKVSAWAGSELESLEKAPASPGRQAVVAEVIDSQPGDEKAAVLSMAKQLIAALKERGGGNIGLDIGRLDALEAQLGEITVTEGIGVRIDEARVGKFTTGSITVGGPPGKT